MEQERQVDFGQNKQNPQKENNNTNFNDSGTGKALQINENSKPPKASNDHVKNKQLEDEEPQNDEEDEEE